MSPATARWYHTKRLQGIRSSLEPLQRKDHPEELLDTVLSPEFVDAEALIMSLPLQHTTCNQAAGHMMLLSPVRARSTARQAQLILADPDNFRDLGSDARQSAHLRGGQIALAELHLGDGDVSPDFGLASERRVGPTCVFPTRCRRLWPTQTAAYRVPTSGV